MGLILYTVVHVVVGLHALYEVHYSVRFVKGLSYILSMFP